MPLESCTPQARTEAAEDIPLVARAPPNRSSIRSMITTPTKRKSPEKAFITSAISYAWATLLFSFSSSLPKRSKKKNRPGVTSSCISCIASQFTRRIVGMVSQPVFFVEDGLLKKRQTIYSGTPHSVTITKHQLYEVGGRSNSSVLRFFRYQLSVHNFSAM